MRSHPGHGAFAWTMLVPSLCLAQVASRPALSGGTALRWNDPNALAATSEAEFEARLSERLGRPAFNPAAAADALAVAWRGTSEQCKVELQLFHGAEVLGTRQLVSPSGDCQSLVPALLTVSALLLESRPVEPEPTMAPPPVSASPPPPEKPPTPADEAEPEREPRVLLSLGAVLGAGLAPKVELGPAASVVFLPTQQVRVGLLGTLFLPHRYDSAPGLSLSHDSLALFGCAMPLSGSFGLGGCANLALHRFHSEGLTLPYPQSQDNATWTTGVALRAEWRIARPLWWIGSLGADVATRPLYFYFTPASGGQSVLFRQQRVLPTLFVGLTLQLP